MLAVGLKLDPALPAAMTHTCRSLAVMPVAYHNKGLKTHSKVSQKLNIHEFLKKEAKTLNPKNAF